MKTFRESSPRAFNIGELLLASRAAGRVCLLIGLFSCTSASAEVLRWSDSQIFTLRGQITQQDLAYFSSHSKELELKGVWVKLNSSGGDVDVAMKIGRIIRSAWGTTQITGDS